MPFWQLKAGQVCGGQSCNRKGNRSFKIAHFDLQLVDAADIAALGQVSPAFDNDAFGFCRDGKIIYIYAGSIHEDNYVIRCFIDIDSRLPAAARGQSPRFPPSIAPSDAGSFPFPAPDSWESLR